ncbi:MAG: formate-dependent phosphoribosylglycinamide formyltransferase [Prevotella sp.]|nr:formate-dependent phosphoribosylglycinamide formyltransferase [Prevotella sp.]MDD7029390.1 formate-dependent phosphoribosylglycinamide formyltransferase [Prevotellaceae bacterium]MDD7075820.1 formate-dependent phosphoribosylglycinamide formyltransferase [Prevotellaceae bacterium]MDY5210140.1 formate-dependent phosphoribosylglycinamide formyltransferase [Prevotella sp.]MDY5344286.1 formate-dependent phosphoribosylglycinamide formyltransferase [Prevotella sp.]
MKKILLLGSGELGKEFVIAAKRAGQYVIACDRYDNAPAMQVADEREVFSMLDGDALDAAVKKHHPDIIVPEIEAIRVEKLFEYENQGIQVVPSARAVNFTMNRRAIRDLASRVLGLRTAKYFYAKTYDEFKKAADEIGFPCVVKPLMSSSGHGQSYVHNDGELEAAFRNAMEGSRGDVKEVIIEEFIDFDSEFTLLTVTQKNGDTLFCPPIGHVQKAGDYRESWQPYKISDEALAKAQEMAAAVTKALTGAGIWGVEFFLTKQGEVIFSELSPRPHDTGMVTLGHTTNLSEFELHFRAVMGLPIAGIHLEHAGASAVVLSPVESDKPLDYNLNEALKQDHTRIRIFGKPEAHVGRRMGVVLCYGVVADGTDALREKAKAAAKTILGTDPYTVF